MNNKTGDELRRLKHKAYYRWVAGASRTVLRGEAPTSTAAQATLTSWYLSVWSLSCLCRGIRRIRAGKAAEAAAEAAEAAAEEAAAAAGEVVDQHPEGQQQTQDMQQQQQQRYAQKYAHLSEDEVLAAVSDPSEWDMGWTSTDYSQHPQVCGQRGDRPGQCHLFVSGVLFSPA